MHAWEDIITLNLLVANGQAVVVSETKIETVPQRQRAQSGRVSSRPSRKAGGSTHYRRKEESMKRTDSVGASLIFFRSKCVWRSATHQALTKLEKIKRGVERLCKKKKKKNKKQT